MEIKCQLDATEVFIADLIACSTCFGHHYAYHQELEYYIVVAACGISCCKNVKNNFVIQSHPTNRIPDPQTKLCTTKKPTKNTHTQPPRHSTHLVTNLDNTQHLRLRTQIPQNLQNYFLHFYSMKYHRQQPLYNTLELLMMGIVMSKTC